MVREERKEQLQRQGGALLGLNLAVWKVLLQGPARILNRAPKATMPS